jgi:hypothetical protein
MKKLILLILIAACGGGTTEPAPTLQARSYAYSSTVEGTTRTGALVVTYATADSIAGSWAVSSFQQRAGLGFRNGDAYVLYAYSAINAKVYAHRIRPDGTCTIQLVGSSYTGECSIR